MNEIEVQPIQVELLASVLSAERAKLLSESMKQARECVGDRTVWHVNATSQGGGVAEMLPTLLGYGRGAGMSCRWLVLDGDPEFFDVTKRIHNLLHGNPGDDGDLGSRERRCYERVLADNLAAMLALVEEGDVVILHDPQTAGLVDGLRDAGVRVVWRSHIGRDTENDETAHAWAFLRQYIEHADALVFSRDEYRPAWVDPERSMVIAPSIDPFTQKNRDLDPEELLPILVRCGLVSGKDGNEPVLFNRRDGSVDTVRRHSRLIADGSPPPADARLVVQVSRWDRLKDMNGVLDGFARTTSTGAADAHLMLVGPDVDGVSDDPEGAAVFAECQASRRALPESVRSRVHLVNLPMDDLEENALIVNAVQRHAAVIVQKSLAEGFGLTVTEAMWKAKPVIASRVGGIQDQIRDGQDGFLLDDPTDLGALAAVIERVLSDGDLAERVGAHARERVRDHFLDDRQLAQHAELFDRVCAPELSRRR